MLHRRAFLGIDLAGVPAVGGARVRSVHPGGPAEAAGLVAGDVLVSVDGEPASEPADVTRALRGRAGASVPIRFERDGARQEALLVPKPLPLESIESGRVVLGEVEVGGHALRTILTVPLGTPPFGAMVYLQGVDTGSCEHPFERDHPVRRLVSHVTAKSFVTLRVERSGIGDSEGPPPSETGLDVEIATANAAIEAIASYEGVDSARVFVFGSSLGGMIAPLCASLSRARGALSFGTSAKRWRSCAVGTIERQLAMRGYRGEELAERVALWAELHAAVCRDGLSPAEAMARRPHLAVLESRECRGDTLFGRSSAFFRALEAKDLRAAWARVDCDVAVIRGEHDWVCDAGDAASVLDACGPRARMLELPGIGHDMRRHTSLERSYRAPLSGEWDGSVAEATVGWMREAALARR